MFNIPFKQIAMSYHAKFVVTLVTHLPTNYVQLVQNAYPQHLHTIISMSNSTHKIPTAKSMGIFVVPCAIPQTHFATNSHQR